METRKRVVLPVLCLVLLGACSESAPDTASTPLSESPGSATSPVAHTDRQMEAALPSVSDLPGGQIDDTCRTFTATCDGWLSVSTKSSYAGAAGITGLTVGTRPRVVQKMRRECSEGEYRTPVTYDSRQQTTYTPGEQGVRKRLELDRQGWDGFGCLKRVRYLHPNHAPTDRRGVTQFWVTDGTYLVSVIAPSQRLARTLMTEYLDRLDSTSTD